MTTIYRTAAVIAAIAFSFAAATADAKDKVKVGFIGPLTGGVSVNGLGGRNSADLAVRLRNADPKAKYEYEMVVLDDECKPNVAVQVATKMAADKDIIAGATHYCSATAIATVDVYHKFGFPVIVWGAVLPDITYRNKYDEVHRVNGTMINQNDANAELISKLGYKTVAVIHDTTDYGKGHNEYFSKALAKTRQGQYRRHLRRDRRPAGLHRRAHQDQGAQSRRDLFRRTDADRRTHPLADGQARHQGRVRRHLRHRLRRLHPGSRTAGGRHARLPRRRADRETAGRQVLHGKIQRPEIRQPAGSLWRLRLRRDGHDPGHDREGRPDRKKVIAELGDVKDRDSIVGKITFDDHGQNTVPVITKYVVQDGKFVEWDDSEYASGKRKLPGQK